MKTSPSEKVTVGIPIYIQQKEETPDSEKKNMKSNTMNGNSKWILPISDNNGFEMNENPSKIERILERFACLHVASSNVAKEVYAAKKIRAQQESEDAESGPRSIAQVRR